MRTGQVQVSGDRRHGTQAGDSISLSLGVTMATRQRPGRLELLEGDLWTVLGEAHASQGHQGMAWGECRRALAAIVSASCSS